MSTKNQILGKMKMIEAWEAKIFCGLRKGYTEEIFSIEKIYEVCQEYCDQVGWCVTVTPTRFIYKNGYEPGAIVGIISYPRFPISKEDLRNRTVCLATKLLKELKQLRISVVFPEDTIMIER